jgi:hypothetical protein
MSNETQPQGVTRMQAILLGVAHAGFVLLITFILLSFYSGLGLFSALSKSPEVYAEIRLTWFATLGIVAVLLAILAGVTQFALRNNRALKYANVPGYVSWVVGLITLAILTL